MPPKNAPPLTVLETCTEEDGAEDGEDGQRVEEPQTFESRMRSSLMRAVDVGSRLAEAPAAELRINATKIRGLGKRLRELATFANERAEVTNAHARVPRTVSYQRALFFLRSATAAAEELLLRSSWQWHRTLLQSGTDLKLFERVHQTLDRAVRDLAAVLDASSCAEDLAALATHALREEEEADREHAQGRIGALVSSSHAMQAFLSEMAADAYELSEAVTDVRAQREALLAAAAAVLAAARKGRSLFSWRGGKGSGKMLAPPSPGGRRRSASLGCALDEEPEASGRDGSGSGDEEGSGAGGSDDGAEAPPAGAQEAAGSDGEEGAARPAPPLSVEAGEAEERAAKGHAGLLSTLERVLTGHLALSKGLLLPDSTHSMARPRNEASSVMGRLRRALGGGGGGGGGSARPARHGPSASMDLSRVLLASPAPPPRPSTAPHAPPAALQIPLPAPAPETSAPSSSSTAAAPSTPSGTSSPAPGAPYQAGAMKKSVSLPASLSDRLKAKFRTSISSQHRTFVVDRGWAGPGAGQEEIPPEGGSVTVGSIATALALARPGDTVLIHPGVYRESLRVERGVTVRGVGAPQQIVIESEDGPAVTFCGPAAAPLPEAALPAPGPPAPPPRPPTPTGRPPTPTGRGGGGLAPGRPASPRASPTTGPAADGPAPGLLPAARVGAGSLDAPRPADLATMTLVGLTLRQVPSGSGATAAAVAMQSGVAVLENCSVTSRDGPGVLVSPACRGTLRQCEVRACGSHGVVLEPACKGATLELCDVRGNALCGVRARRRAAPVIRGCVVRENGAAGHGSRTLIGLGPGRELGAPDGAEVPLQRLRRGAFLVTDEGAGLFEECDVAGGAMPAAEVLRASSPAFARCVVRDVDGPAFVFEDAGGTVEGCDLYGNAGHALLLRRGAFPTVRANKIHDRLGILITDRARGVIERNEARRAAPAGPALAPGPRSDARGAALRERLGGDCDRGGASPVVRANRIVNGRKGGIYIYAGSSGLIEENEIRRNMGTGVEVCAKSCPTLRRNVIIEGRDGHGIEFLDGAGGLAEENVIQSCPLWGVCIGSGSDPTLRRNRIASQRGGGVWVNGDASPLVEANEIALNASHGVRVDAGRPIVRSNQIKENHGAGIWVAEGAGGTYTGNVLNGNQGGALKRMGAGGVPGSPSGPSRSPQQAPRGEGQAAAEESPWTVFRLAAPAGLPAARNAAHLRRWAARVRSGRVRVARGAELEVALAGGAGAEQRAAAAQLAEACQEACGGGLRSFAVSCPPGLEGAAAALLARACRARSGRISSFAVLHSTGIQGREQLVLAACFPGGAFLAEPFPAAPGAPAASPAAAAAFERALFALSLHALDDLLLVPPPGPPLGPGLAALLRGRSRRCLASLRVAGQRGAATLPLALSPAAALELAPRAARLLPPGQWPPVLVLEEGRGGEGGEGARGLAPLLAGPARLLSALRLDLRLGPGQSGAALMRLAAAALRAADSPQQRPVTISVGGRVPGPGGGGAGAPVYGPALGALIGAAGRGLEALGVRSGLPLGFEEAAALARLRPAASASSTAASTSASTPPLLPARPLAPALELLELALGGPAPSAPPPPPSSPASSPPPPPPSA
eukprot:tig00020616_g12282.t1